MRKLVVLPGDGIGPEVVGSALKVLEACRDRFGLEFEMESHLVGGAAIDQFGEPLPSEALEACRASRVVLLGAVGDPRFDTLPPERRPEKGLLLLRKELGLFANLRPIKLYTPLLEASPLRPERLAGTDILFVRELTGGIYFGEPRGRTTVDGRRVAFNTEVYSDHEIERIARVAFEAARLRRRRVTSVDKSNVLEASQLWKSIVTEISRDYPDIELRHMLVDNCAMQLIADPAQFDVILTNNIFGDILSDEAAMLTGSIGMLPSASLGARTGEFPSGLYEPVHGSAPDIAGQGRANPLATIGSLAMLLRYSWGREDVARAVESAIARVLEDGCRTSDLSAGPGTVGVSTEEMTSRVVGAIGK